MTELLDLPIEIKFHIFSFLDHENLLIVNQVCKEFYDITANSSFGVKVVQRMCLDDNLIVDTKDIKNTIKLISEVLSANTKKEILDRCINKYVVIACYNRKIKINIINKAIEFGLDDIVLDLSINNGIKISNTFLAIKKLKIDTVKTLISSRKLSTNITNIYDYISINNPEILRFVLTLNTTEISKLMSIEYILNIPTPDKKSGENALEIYNIIKNNQSTINCDTFIINFSRFSKNFLNIYKKKYKKVLISKNGVEICVINEHNKELRRQLCEIIDTYPNSSNKYFTVMNLLMDLPFYEDAELLDFALKKIQSGIVIRIACTILFYTSICAEQFNSFKLLSDNYYQHIYINRTCIIDYNNSKFRDYIYCINRSFREKIVGNILYYTIMVPLGFILSYFS